MEPDIVITNIRGSKDGHSGHSRCVTCGKDMPGCWDTVCATCGDTSCYKCSTERNGHWHCSRHSKGSPWWRATKFFFMGLFFFMAVAAVFLGSLIAGVSSVGSPGMGATTWLVSVPVGKIMHFVAGFVLGGIIAFSVRRILLIMREK